MKNNSNNRSNNNQQPVRIRGLTIEVKYDNVDRAVKKLKKRIDEDGRLEKVRDNQYYQKPSERKRLAKKAAIIRRQIELKSDILDASLSNPRKKR